MVAGSGAASAIGRGRKAKYLRPGPAVFICDKCVERFHDDIAEVNESEPTGMVTRACPVIAGASAMPLHTS
jgi:hypothetical protein